MAKSWCGYSNAAAAALDALGAPYTRVDLDGRPDGADLQRAFSALSGIRTVPQVFLRGAFVGDGSTTVRLARDGSLAERLAAAGLRLRPPGA